MSAKDMNVLDLGVSIYFLHPRLTSWTLDCISDFLRWLVCFIFFCDYYLF